MITISGFHSFKNFAQLTTSVLILGGRIYILLSPPFLPLDLLQDIERLFVKYAEFFAWVFLEGGLVCWFYIFYVTTKSCYTLRSRLNINIVYAWNPVRWDHDQKDFYHVLYEELRCKLAQIPI